MRMPWRRSRCAKKESPKEKERWCYVGRARVKGYGNTYPWWVYLHPTDDVWYFLGKRHGLAYPMGSYREWTRYYEFEPLVNKEN